MCNYVMTIGVSFVDIQSVVLASFLDDTCLACGSCEMKNVLIPDDIGCNITSTKIIANIKFK